MKRNKPKKTTKTLRGRTIIKKLKGNTILLPGGGRYRVGESICFSGQGITPIKRKGKVGKVGYSIADYPDLIDYKPEVGVGYGVGFEVGCGVGHEVGDWKAYTYHQHAVPAPAPASAPFAWTSWWRLLCQYGRELREAFACVLGSPAPAVAPTPTPAPTPAVPPAEIDAGTIAAWPKPKRKRKPRRRKD